MTVRDTEQGIIRHGTCVQYRPRISMKPSTTYCRYDPTEKKYCNCGPNTVLTVQYNVHTVHVHRKPPKIGPAMRALRTPVALCALGSSKTL